MAAHADQRREENMRSGAAALDPVPVHAHAAGRRQKTPASPRESPVPCDRVDYDVKRQTALNPSPQQA